MLVFGGTGIDTLVPVPGLPLPLVDSFMAGPIRDTVSHTGTCVALALSRLGVDVQVVDGLGDDEPGRLVREAFQEWGIPLHTALAPLGTRRAVNLMTPDGTRLSCYDARFDADFRLPPSLYRPLLPGCRHVHVSIMDFCRYVLDDVRAAGATVSTDLHDWDGTDAYHGDFAYGADIVFLSGVKLTDPGDVGDAVAQIFGRGVAQLVVVTAGARGATLFRRGEPPFPLPAGDPGAPVVDSNGAGDASAAAFLAARLAGHDPETALRHGMAAGAFACTRPVGPDSFIDAHALTARLAA